MSKRASLSTTGFVGDKGAKDYVVSMADLHDLQVELDINQNDFAKLGPAQPGIITTDAYPDRNTKATSRKSRPKRTGRKRRSRLR